MAKKSFQDRVTTQQVGEQVKTIKGILAKMNRNDERVKLEILIPGKRNDVVVIARRARLTMVQLMYDRKVLGIKEAFEALDGNLSPKNPDTYFDDSGLLTIRPEDRDKPNDKENNDGK